MKKLYRKGTVHPSPPVISDHLAFLPAAILALTAALSLEDREVLAYLLSCPNNFSVNNISIYGHRKNTHQKNVSFAKSKTSGVGGGGNSSRSNSTSNDHPPVFNCDCFRCYMSYWVKWDASPNRQLIHEIIDAYEDELMRGSSGNGGNNKKKNNKKDKKKKSSIGNNENSGESKRSELSLGKNELAESLPDSVKETATRNIGADNDGDEGFGGDGDEEEKGTVRKFVSFIGERIWGAWFEKI